MVATAKPHRIFYGWWVVAGSLGILATIGGIILYGFTAFFNPIVAEMGWTSAQTSLAFSLKSVEGGLLGPIIGLMVDRMGARTCMLIGVCIISAAFFLLSRITSLPLLYLSFALLALGFTAACGIAQYTAVANWFRRRRSLAMGILSAGFGISGVTTPILVLLINRFGWRLTLVILAVATLAIGIPLTFLVRHRPEPYGYLPDGDRPEAAKTAAAASQKPTRATGPELSFRQAVRTRAFWFLMLFNFFVGFSFSAITVHEMPYLISIGIAESLAALTMLGITTSSVVGRLGFSWLGDTRDKRKLLAITAAMQTVGVLIFANIRSPWMILLFLLAYGPGLAWIPLSSAIQADYFGTKSFASLRGVFSLSGAIPGLIAPFFAGWMFDMHYGYRLAFVIFAVLCGLAVPAVLLARPTHAAQAV